MTKRLLRWNCCGHSKLNVRTKYTFLFFNMSYTRGDLLGGLPSLTSTPSTISTGGFDDGDDKAPSDYVAQGKTKLYQIVDGAESKEWCLGMIGSGGHTFCVNKGCKVKHRGGDKFLLEESHLYVLKEPGVPFVAPSVKSEDITGTLRDNWLNASKSWNEWAKLFGMVRKFSGRYEPPRLRCWY